eukprot:m.32953 g.32953  ORF g.32953 m.32953 type:complete len:482 (+) comp10214_c0_seq1:231-1676(+)
MHQQPFCLSLCDQPTTTMPPVTLPMGDHTAAAAPSKPSGKLFPALGPCQPSNVFLLAGEAKACTSAHKIDLVLGAYRGADGKPWVLPAVAQAEAIVAKQLSAGELNYEYLPISGLPAFCKHAVRLVLGSDNQAFLDSRAQGLQCLSGTGSLRVAFEFLARLASGDADSDSPRNIFISNPSWGNHINLAEAAGLRVQRYRYFDADTCGVDEQGLLEDLEAAPLGSVVVLQPCAHNPTGVDPTLEQWCKIADVCSRRQLFPVFDIAYQGLASGDLDTDAEPVRLFERLGLGFFVCQSMSKNFGLYAERTGCLTVVAPTASEASLVVEHCKTLARTLWSNPPHRGARIVATILSDPELEAEWRDNVRTMAARIRQMRVLFHDSLVAAGSTLDWSHVLKQSGMFSFTGISAENCRRLKHEAQIFMLESGRVNVCAITPDNVGLLAHGIHRVLSSTEAVTATADEVDLPSLAVGTPSTAGLLAVAS